MSSPGTVRIALASDLDAVLSIDDLARNGDGARRELLRDAINAGTCIVCEQRTQIVGYAVVNPRHFYGRDFVEVLVVAADNRRIGAGRCLLQAAVARATTDQVFTSTNRSNAPMRALLRAEAWIYSGELTGLDDDDPEFVYFQGRA